jgi:hypothetical protein
MIKAAAKNVMALRPSKEDIQDQVLRIGGAALILTGSIALKNATHHEHKSTKRSPAVIRTYLAGQAKEDALLPTGPSPADRSPGTPDPEDSRPSTAGLGSIVEGVSNDVPMALVPGESKSLEVIPAQVARIAFTGPMKITMSPFAGDQSIVSKPAGVVGQGGPVNPASEPKLPAIPVS